MDLHVPVHINVPGRSPARVIESITTGLDAVVIGQKLSTLYKDSIHLRLAGNPRDLAIAAERAAELGGVVDVVD